MIIDQAQPYKNEVTELLAAEKLPVADLPEMLDNFIVAIEHGSVVGIAGMEIYGNYGLLRSVAVRPAFRSQGIAAKLLRRIDALGSVKGLTEIYLLTETTSDYFERKGFVRITRGEVPEELQRSSEFTHVCPQSAMVMKKSIR